MKADSGTLTEFGFTWGPIEVSRCTTLERGDSRTRVVQIKVPGRALDIYVSETGRSIRIREGSMEWIAPLREAQRRSSSP